MDTADKKLEHTDNATDIVDTLKMINFKKIKLD